MRRSKTEPPKRYSTISHYFRQIYSINLSLKSIIAHIARRYKPELLFIGKRSNGFFRFYRNVKLIADVYFEFRARLSFSCLTVANVPSGLTANSLQHLRLVILDVPFRRPFCRPAQIALPFCITFIMTAQNKNTTVKPLWSNEFTMFSIKADNPPLRRPANLSWVTLIKKTRQV